MADARLLRCLDARGVERVLWAASGRGHRGALQSAWAARVSFCRRGLPVLKSAAIGGGLAIRKRRMTSHE
jgi:hypothetical protein